MLLIFLKILLKQMIFCWFHYISWVWLHLLWSHILRIFPLYDLQSLYLKFCALLVYVIQFASFYYSCLNLKKMKMIQRNLKNLMKIYFPLFSIFSFYLMNYFFCPYIFFISIYIKFIILNI